ncbi:MAG: hypothetical protein HXY30_08940 [Pseudorhodoplanes sp.]|nr:hypothetical protein [Pseudorhodoplanes sp.]
MGRLAPNLAPYIVGGIVTAAVLELAGSPLDWARPSAALSQSGAAHFEQVVDRSGKGDRLQIEAERPFHSPGLANRERVRPPLTPVRDIPGPGPSRTENKLPVACEPVVSSITRSPLARESGRCVT